MPVDLFIYVFKACNQHMDSIFFVDIKTSFGNERCEDSCKDRWKKGVFEIDL